MEFVPKASLPNLFVCYVIVKKRVHVCYTEVALEQDSNDSRA